MAHDFMTDPDFLELFPELKQAAPAVETPAAIKKARHTAKKEREDRHTEQAMKTIQWKFKDALSEYPEIRHLNTMKVHGPKDIADNFRFLIDHETVEHFIVFWLSSGNKVIGYEIVSIGNLNSSIVHPREVFRGAIVASCANIILMHNHPSGNVEPSPEDVSITKRIVESGKLLDIHVFDHIIVTNDSYLSFTEERLI